MICTKMSVCTVLTAWRKFPVALRSARRFARLGWISCGERVGEGEVGRVGVGASSGPAHFTPRLSSFHSRLPIRGESALPGPPPLDTLRNLFAAHAVACKLFSSADFVPNATRTQHNRKTRA